MPFKKGNIPWSKGKRGISLNTGRTQFKKGNHVRTEFKKGNKAHLGYKHSEELKNKMREVTKKYLKIHNHPMFGKHHSIETKEKISKSRTGKNLRHTYNLGRKQSKQCIRKRLRRRISSSLEEKMIGIIQKLQLPYRFVGDGKFFIENKCPDFINVDGEKIAIEVYYRKHKEMFKGDVELWKNERQEIFKKYGWTIKFFDETQVNEEIVRRRLSF